MGEEEVIALRSILKKSTKASVGDDRKVAFSNLEILEFLICIGDNPSCEGAPLCMSNECQKKQMVPLNEFEIKRQARRGRKQLVISPTKRSRLYVDDLRCSVSRSSKG